MFTITITNELKEKCPRLALGTILCQVKNSDYDSGLWQEIDKEATRVRDTFKIEEIKEQPIIAATREAYKKTGKDPNRYRPSAESLYRRIVRGIELYQITTLVDLVNLVSIKYGISIGGFDADKVVGDVYYGIGEEGEPYCGIGRGGLNIAGLPVLRDEVGGIGTPTSDEVRTAIQPGTTRFYMNINGYAGKEFLPEIMDYSISLLKRFVKAHSIESFIVGQ
ncbi:MAG: B3/4 domain-containing protein [Bacteroidota bacterium]